MPALVVHCIFHFPFRSFECVGLAGPRAIEAVFGFSGIGGGVLLLQCSNPLERSLRPPSKPSLRSGPRRGEGCEL